MSFVLCYRPVTPMALSYLGLAKEKKSRHGKIFLLRLKFSAIMPIEK